MKRLINAKDLGNGIYEYTHNEIEELIKKAEGNRTKIEELSREISQIFDPAESYLGLAFYDPTIVEMYDNMIFNLENKLEENDAEFDEVEAFVLSCENSGKFTDDDLHWLWSCFYDDGYSLEGMKMLADLMLSFHGKDKDFMWQIFFGAGLSYSQTKNLMKDLKNGLSYEEIIKKYNLDVELLNLQEVI